MTKEELRRKYLELTNEQMPIEAIKHQWLVKFNHCFQRIILDTIFQDYWYNHLESFGRTPAYRQLSVEQLQQAVDLAHQMLEMPRSVKKLNRQSLRYRGKIEDTTN